MVVVLVEDSYIGTYPTFPLTLHTGMLLICLALDWPEPCLLVRSHHLVAVVALCFVLHGADHIIDVSTLTAEVAHPYPHLLSDRHCRVGDVAALACGEGLAVSSLSMPAFDRTLSELRRAGRADKLPPRSLHNKKRSRRKGKRIFLYKLSSPQSLVSRLCALK